jgi:hypothetical protein
LDPEVGIGLVPCFEPEVGLGPFFEPAAGFGAVPCRDGGVRPGTVVSVPHFGHFTFPCEFPETGIAE